MTLGIVALAIALMIVIVALLRDISLRNKIQKLENDKADRNGLINQIKYTNSRLQEKLDDATRLLNEVHTEMKGIRDRAEERKKKLQEILDDFNNLGQNNIKEEVTNVQRK